MTLRDWIGKNKDALLKSGLGDDWKLASGVTGGAGWCLYDGPGNASAAFFWGIDGIITAVNDGSGVDWV